MGSVSGGMLLLSTESYNIGMFLWISNFRITRNIGATPLSPNAFVRIYIELFTAVIF